MPSSSDGIARLAAAVVERAAQCGVRIAVAESLTGGLVVAALVAVPGASRAVSGGIVAYDTELKATLLGVDRALLRERGPVDSEVAEQMAAGVRLACAVPGVSPGVGLGMGLDTDAAADGELPAAGLPTVGVSTTGVAGPDPDPHTGQPAGTVWLGVSSARGARSVRLVEGASGRQAIREAAVARALQLLLEELEELEGHGSSQNDVEGHQ